MLHYDAGTIKVVVKEAQSGSTSDKYPLITGVPLGARFSYTISDLGNGNLCLGELRREQPVHHHGNPQPFRGATVRFPGRRVPAGRVQLRRHRRRRITFYTLRERATPGTEHRATRIDVVGRAAVVVASLQSSRIPCGLSRTSQGSRAPRDVRGNPQGARRRTQPPAHTPSPPHTACGPRTQVLTWF